MNDLLRTVIDKGTTTPFKSVMQNQVNARLAQADWVGKTGTSNDFVDAWLIISTPGITTGSWMGIGGDEHVSMNVSASRNNSTFLAYLLNAVYQVRPDIFKVDERFTLDPSVIRSQVSSFTGERPGKVTVDGHEIQTPGNTITSLWALNGAPASTFRFGIGGTTANFNKVWEEHLPEHKDDEDEEDEKKDDEHTDESGNHENDDGSETTTTTTNDDDD
jgi:penicillin-binding protein